MTEQNDSKKFHTIDGTVIMNKQMPPLRYTIAEILPAGLTLFSGDSKIGKSLLAVNMCVAVSKGEPFLDFPTHRGTVLYLALEDTESRIQRRVFSLTDTLDSNFHFSNERYRLDDGLIEAMEDFITEHPDTNLIVIDVLQYIRPQSKGGNVYKEDYNDMIPLHEFTQRHHNLSLVLIHHTNKSNVSDQLRASSGSTAIVGAVDNYWLLQRPMRALRSGSLYCSGREISDKEIRLSLNESGIWIPKDLDNYKGEVLSSVVVGTYLWVMWHTDILDIDEKTGKHRLEYICTATELAEKVSQLMDMTIPANMVKKNLTMHHHQLEQMGLRFENRRTGKRRYFIFSHVPESLRRTIQTSDELPKYINDAPTAESDEDDGDSMTAEQIVDMRCHRPTKGPLPISVSPFNGNHFATPNHSRTQRIEKEREGSKLGDNDSATDDGNAPLPT